MIQKRTFFASALALTLLTGCGGSDAPSTLSTNQTPSTVTTPSSTAISPKEAKASALNSILPLVATSSNADSFVQASLEQIIPLVNNSSQAPSRQAVSLGSIVEILKNPLVTSVLTGFYNFVKTKVDVDASQSTMLTSFLNVAIDEIFTLLTTFQQDTTPSTTAYRAFSFAPDATINFFQMSNSEATKSMNFTINTSGSFSYWSYTVDDGAPTKVNDSRSASLSTSSLSSGEHHVYFALYDSSDNVITQSPRVRRINIEETTPRADHAPQNDADTETLISKLNANTISTINIEDAKYFVSELKKDINNYYNAEEQLFILNQEILPSASTTLFTLSDMLESSDVMTAAFQQEATNDLNGSQDDILQRSTALAGAIDNAMSQMSMDVLTGRSTSSYGDKVVISATDVDINICLVFFLCQSSGSATVSLEVTNPGTDGNSADFGFQTRVSGTGMSANEVSFNNVDAKPNSYFRGKNYDLNLNEFTFSRSSGDVHLGGDGSLSSAKSATTMTLSNYDIDLKVRGYQDVTQYTLIDAGFNLTGELTTASGKKLVGSSFFDASQPAKNHFSGVLSAGSNDPVIEGAVKTTLTYEDLKYWLTERKAVHPSLGIPYIIYPDNSKKLISELRHWSRDEYIGKNFNTGSSMRCYPNSDLTEYNCDDWYRNDPDGVIKFTKKGETLAINNGNEDYYILNISNFDTFTQPEVTIVSSQTGKQETLSYFDYQRSMGVVSVITRDLNAETTIDNIGDKSYSMNVNVKKDGNELNADMIMIRDVNNDTWSYIANNLVMKEAGKVVTADRLLIKETGAHRFSEKINDILNAPGAPQASSRAYTKLNNSTVFFGIEALSFLNIDEIILDNFVLDLPRSNGERAKIVTNFYAHNNRADLTLNVKDNFTFDINNTFSYLDHLYQTDFDGTVNIVKGETETEFLVDSKLTGTISSDKLPTENFTIQEKQISSTQKKRFIVLENDSNGYQIGITSEINEGGTTTIDTVDSYGITSNITMDEAFTTFESMSIKDLSANELGNFNKATDEIKIFYTDGTEGNVFLVE
jgi:hypothetical protein